MKIETHSENTAFQEKMQYKLLQTHNNIFMTLTSIIPHPLKGTKILLAYAITYSFHKVI